MDTAKLKVPPHSIDAEQSVLGGLMLDGDAWDLIADRLDDSDFYRSDHRVIYQAIRALQNRGQPCDVITLSEELQSRNAIEDAGGLAYLGEIAQATPSSANIAAYADIIRERSVTRRLTQVGSRIAEAGFNPDGRTVAELLDLAEREVFEIAEQGSRGKKGFVSIEQVLPEVVEQLDELFNSDSSITGLATGFSDLDEKTAGLQKGDLVILAARPSMGKTALAMTARSPVRKLFVSTLPNEANRRFAS